MTHDSLVSRDHGRTEISCIDRFRHDISWRNIGPAIFRDLLREIAISRDSTIYRVVNAGQRKSDPLQCPSTRYSASPLFVAERI